VECLEGLQLRGGGRTELRGGPALVSDYGESNRTELIVHLLDHRDWKDR
jgi:hypothetical protein